MNDFCRHVCAEALVNNAQFSKLDPFTPKRSYVSRKKTAGDVRNLNSDVVNVSAGDAIAEAK